MSQEELERELAAITGEELRTIRRPGFSWSHRSPSLIPRMISNPGLRWDHQAARPL